MLLFHQFEPVTLSCLEKVVQDIKRSGSPNDVIPPRLFKETFSSLGPFALHYVNCSLAQGVVPANFKHAVVQPLLEKSDFDPSVLSNFRPISKLPFLSKILEKIVFNQLKAFLEEHGIPEVFQSVFKNLHSIESALLKG